MNSDDWDALIFWTCVVIVIICGIVVVMEGR